MHQLVVICLKISIFVVSNTTSFLLCRRGSGCDLLENFYLCGIKHNNLPADDKSTAVVICLKISIFVVSNTTSFIELQEDFKLWFAWKFLSLWYQTQLVQVLLLWHASCDLLENFYLCGIKHNFDKNLDIVLEVVICLKISIFVVSNTTKWRKRLKPLLLWFAWKFLSLWYQTQQVIIRKVRSIVVICLKISIFVVSNTTFPFITRKSRKLWFAWKFLSLWYQTQRTMRRSR